MVGWRSSASAKLSPPEMDERSELANRANALLGSGNTEVKRVPYPKALRAETTHQTDYVTPYVGDLASVIDMSAIRSAGLRIGVDPLGGAASTTGDRSPTGTAWTSP